MPDQSPAQPGNAHDLLIAVLNLIRDYPERHNQEPTAETYKVSRARAADRPCASGAVITRLNIP